MEEVAIFYGHLVYFTAIGSILWIGANFTMPSRSANAAVHKKEDEEDYVKKFFFSSSRSGWPGVDFNATISAKI
jgi:hypothetical protein